MCEEKFFKGRYYFGRVGVVFGVYRIVYRGSFGWSNFWSIVEFL